MKKSVPQRLNKKPLIALAIILFGAGIAYYTNASMNKREGLEGAGETGDIPTPPVPTASPPPGTPGYIEEEEEQKLY